MNKQLSSTQAARPEKVASLPPDRRWAAQFRRACNRFFVSRNMPQDTHFEIMARNFAKKVA